MASATTAITGRANGNMSHGESKIEQFLQMEIAARRQQ